jgi:hypothetical protein
VLNSRGDSLEFLWSDFDAAQCRYLGERERLHQMQMERNKIEQRLKLLKRLLEFEGNTTS